ncbi:MAG: PHP domain-containing protein [Myxococcales bacterium]
MVRDAHRIGADLREIAALLGLSKDAARFKAKAYEQGALLVDSVGDVLGELIGSGSLIDVKGIGPSLCRDIQEIWHTGCSSLLQRLREQHPLGTGQLAQIPGLTARRIGVLQEKLHVTSVAMLEELCRKHEVRGLPGFGARVEERVLAGIEAARKPRRGPIRLRLAEALGLAERLREELQQALPSAQVELSGGVRRRDELVDEIALVIVGAEESAALDAVAGLSSVIYLNRARCQARLSDGIGLSVYLAPSESAGAGRVRASSTGEHWAALVERARERGLALQVDGLYDHGQRLPQSGDEAGLYATLGLPAIPAELRGPWQAPGELFARDTFDDLLSEQDVRGAVHCHTTYSDGRNSIEEMALAAEALGLEYITITDHSPLASYAGGVTLDRLARQWDEIAEVQARVKIRILRGTESDILADGALDYPDSVLAQFDVIIASIHGRFGMGRREMTERLVRAMEQPVFKIWGHALGRLLLEREPFECDVEAVLDALARSRGAVEINGDPYRLDLPPEWVPHARKRGIPFVVSVDAHSTQGLNVLPYAVMMARRGGLRRDEVLNTRSVEAFMAQVRPGT